MLFTRKITRTYLDRRRLDSKFGVSENGAHTNRLNKHEIINLDSTGDYTLEKDEFDRLAKTDTPLRVRLKEVDKIRASFNMDSSVEISNSEMPNIQSSTPLRDSVVQRTVTKHDAICGKLFESPVISDESIYTRFITTDSIKSVDITSANEKLDTPKSIAASRSTRLTLRKSRGKRVHRTTVAHDVKPAKSLESSVLSDESIYTQFIAMDSIKSVNITDGIKSSDTSQTGGASKHLTLDDSAVKRNQFYVIRSVEISQCGLSESIQALPSEIDKRSVEQPKVATPPAATTIKSQRSAANSIGISQNDVPKSTQSLSSLEDGVQNPTPKQKKTATPSVAITLRSKKLKSTSNRGSSNRNESVDISQCQLSTSSSRIPVKTSLAIKSVEAKNKTEKPSTATLVAPSAPRSKMLSKLSLRKSAKKSKERDIEVPVMAEVEPDKMVKRRNVMFQANVIEISDDNSYTQIPSAADPMEARKSQSCKRKTKLSTHSEKKLSPSPVRKSLRIRSVTAKVCDPVISQPDIMVIDNCDKLVLTSGKWRKSLAAWKRKTQENLMNNTDRQDMRNSTTSRKSSRHRMSMKVLPNTTKDVLQTIISRLQTSLSESIVLQETDDGLSNLSAELSLRDEPDSGKQFLRQRSLSIYENRFDEESEKSYRQSLLRKRCTSVVEAPTALYTSNTSCTAIDIVKQLNPKEIVLRRCRQTVPLTFSEIYSEQNLHNCRKIGEGVYGEVFMNKTASGNTVVLKIIPIEGELEVNGEPQKKFDEILAEIVIAMELSNLRNGKDFMTNGFVEVINVRCVQGRYPEYLIDLWELYRDNHVTENDHPDIFTDDQLFIVLELSNAGQDLEAFTFSNALQSYSAFIQIAITLAVAEAKFQFEHRDLHWGNVLLIPTEDKEVLFKLNGKEVKIPTHGVKATIIDYTLSRMVFEGCCFYNDLSHDDELFAASGDYQFDIYRFMKNHLGNKWESYEPYTNILWLHYTIDKMINGARYRNNKNKKHRSAIQDMMQLRDELLDYKNSCDYVKCLY